MTVYAHGVGSSADLPLPLDLVLQAGAATVVLSFLTAGLWWRRPRLGGGTERPLPPVWWPQLAVLAFVVYLLGNGIFGPRGPQNPVAHALFVWLWVGLVPVSIVFGPVWRLVNPLRTLFRLLRLRPAGWRPLPPDRPAGPWPAAVALLAFVWFELVAPQRTDPLVVSGWLAGYGLLQLVMAAVRGEQWFARGDCFEVYSELIGRLSPLRWRPPLAGLVAGTREPAAVAGLSGFLAVWWGSTMFDSVSASPVWAGFVQRVGSPTMDGTVGLVLLCLGVFFAVYRTSGRTDVTPSLIPIAAGYTLAHYLSLLLVEGPRGALLLVQQWGLAVGAEWTLQPSAALIAGVQVVVILSGHVLGVVVAHDRALAADPSRPVLATLAGELPMGLFMVACTWAGLFLLFAG